MNFIYLILIFPQLWDINMDSGPVATFQVHENLRPKVSALSLSLSLSSLCKYMTGSFLTQLCDLYENDSIFDKFECCLNGTGTRVATGSYTYEKITFPTSSFPPQTSFLFSYIPPFTTQPSLPRLRHRSRQHRSDHSGSQQEPHEVKRPFSSQHFSPSPTQNLFLFPGGKSSTRRDLGGRSAG